VQVNAEGFAFAFAQNADSRQVRPLGCCKQNGSIQRAFRNDNRLIVSDNLLDTLVVQGENGFGCFTARLMPPFVFTVKGDTEVIALRPISVGDREANFAILFHAA
jgi:hypothetical protein